MENNKSLATVKSSGRSREGEAKGQAEQISNPLPKAFRFPWHFNPLSISSCRDKGAEILGRGLGASGPMSGWGWSQGGSSGVGWSAGRSSPLPEPLQHHPLAPCPPALLSAGESDGKAQLKCDMALTAPENCCKNKEGTTKISCFRCFAKSCIRWGNMTVLCRCNNRLCYRQRVLYEEKCLRDTNL